MLIHQQKIELETAPGISIYNLTPEITDLLTTTELKTGQVLIASQHTTTAVTLNEYEDRLLEDIKIQFQRLFPPDQPYLHNDLHLRVVPPDEPKNAHAHLIAMMFNQTEVVPVSDGKLVLGTWQSILFLDLDGPRHRTIFVQLMGE